MKKEVLQGFWLLLLFLIMGIGSAQEFRMLSDSNKLELRRQSFVLVNLNEVSLDNLQFIFDKKTPIAVTLSNRNEVNQAFVKKYLRYNKQLVIVGENELDSLNTAEIGTIQIKTKDIETIDLASVQITDSTFIRFKGIQELGRINYNNKEIVADSLIFNIWKYSGKLPNFIAAKSGSLKEAVKHVAMFNSKNQLFGVVKSEKGLLSEVTFKNIKNVKVNGYFSFSLSREGGEPILSPQKAGYYFSPDILYVTRENQNNMKEFMGYSLDADFGLSDHFVFGKSIKNTIRKNDTEIIVNNVLFEDDIDRGSVGLFKDRAYFDAGIESRTALKSNFTITAWVKPITQDENNSIMGKGEGFVLKIHEGFLTFTIAGIKDYVSNASPIPLNVWTHIALVHSKANNDLRFFVNGKETDRVELIADYVTSDYNLLIGSNLWEEFFVGYLDGIKIWERELNSQEINLQYTTIPKEESKLKMFVVFGTLVFLFLLGIVLARKIKKKSRNNRKGDFPIITVPSKGSSVSSAYKEQIFCFGTLCVLNEEGIDIAKKLSPLLKKLFTIVFLYSYGDKKGISTKKLTELLWPGMTVKSAKNTRGTNIQNLRMLLNDTSEINLVFEDKMWFLKLSNNCYCDYYTALNYLSYFKNNNYPLESLEEELPKLLTILKKGRFLMSTNDSWLDSHIEKFSNLVIEQCSEYSKKLIVEKHGELLFECAEVMYIYDDLNERALQLKLIVLIHQGKLSLAHIVYDNFAKLYLKLYKEDYPVSFEDMISEHQASL
ncbi:MAG: LamG-like jellyroll fold domain-containing protein [Cellulophaga sp.]